MYPNGLLAKQFGKVFITLTGHYWQQAGCPFPCLKPGRPACRGRPVWPPDREQGIE